MTQSPLVRVLVSFVVVFGMLSVDVHASFAAATSFAETVTVSSGPQITTSTTTVQTDETTPADTDEEDSIEEIPTATNTRPIALKTYRVDATSYTSSPEETDDTPELAADGTCTYFGMIASNFLPIGTKVRIPTQFGDKIFTVHDRMNKRYTHRIDVWMAQKKDMRQFGIKRNLQIEVIEWGTGETNWKHLVGKKRGMCHRLAV